jgi:hypothetical protein
MGRGGSDNNLMYGDGLTSLTRDTVNNGTSTLNILNSNYNPDLLNRPLIEKVNDNFLNILKEELFRGSSFSYGGNSFSGNSFNALKVDRQSSQYPEYLKQFTSSVLSRLLSYKSKSLNESIQSKVFLEKEKANYQIGFSDVTIEEFNRGRYQKFLGTYFYKTPAIGDNIKVDIKEYLREIRNWPIKSQDAQSINTEINKMVINGKESFSFMLEGFAYREDSNTIQFEEGEQLINHPFLLLEQGGIERSVLDNSFLLQGNHPLFGEISVSTETTDLEKVDASQAVLKTSPINVPFKKYSLVDDNNQVIAEANKDGREIFFVPDKFIELADQIIKEKQNKTVRKESSMLVTGKIMEKRGKRKLLQELAEQYPDEKLEISFQHKKSRNKKSKDEFYYKIQCSGIEAKSLYDKIESIAKQ